MSRPRKGTEVPAPIREAVARETRIGRKLMYRYSRKAIARRYGVSSRFVRNVAELAGK